ncbi:hypothetical protein C8R48DRAFT_679532 [Suillus tomentosus]|nr:hypothetical protein C8R48DRAFT_679532 [Suillus tomentosus]
MSMSLFVPLHGAHGSSHDYYIYNVSIDTVIHSSGDPSMSVDFVGYLAVGSLPTVYALYLREQLCLVGYIRPPMLHASPFLNPRTDVPCYVLLLDFSAPPLNLPCLTVVSCENSVYSLYHYVDETNPLGCTVVHLARYPTGYHKITDDDLIAFSDIFTASGQGTSIYAQSRICSESANDIAAGPSNAAEFQQNATTPAEPQAASATDRSIQKVMKMHDNWRHPLAHLRVLIRIAICCGTTENPHLIVQKNERNQRTEVIHRLWPLCLIRSNVDPSTLEKVISRTTKKPITEDEILKLASPWFSQFNYDVRRRLNDTLDSRAGFGLGDGAYGDVLTDKILECIRMFIRPFAHVLPLSDNGFYQFLIHQIAKEIVHHVIFRPTETCQVELTIADLEPEKFRNAPHLPWEAMAFFASSCYEVLLKRLSHRPNYRVLLATHPSPSQVFMELKETDIQTNSQEFVSFNSVSASLYDIMTVATARTSKSSLPTQSLIAIAQLYRLSPIFHFLDIEQTEEALLGWLQTKGCDALPESLMITASVVFGLVDAHDLITLIDTCLKEVSVRTQLQREEGSCMVFLSREGRCLMQDRMYRAQLEVSLFSNAIANLCEELEIRNHPIDRQRPAAVDVAVYAGVRPARSLVHVDYFQPSKATEEKCNAWLLASSHSQGITQVDPDTIRALLDSPKTIEVPHLSERLLRPDDLLSLPRLLKTWVDNVTYHAYMNASFAECKPVHTIDRKSFKTKEQKSVDVLKSDVRILDLKKQRAQAEVDMFSEAMERLSEFKGTSDGICSEPIMFDSRLPDNYLDNWFSESSLSFSSDTSVLL